MVELRLTLYIVLFAVLFFSFFTTQSNSVVDFGGVGQPSSILMILASKALVCLCRLEDAKMVASVVVS